ncbi:MAG: FkbM family methyltransferase [Firmicutes bacterium]|nr:FkbM family methyltransferase [[Eubacterium] siraeum]MCM1487323.1 FkbM family methyltransferase [Bacillota bacterium]
MWKWTRTAILRQSRYMSNKKTDLWQRLRAADKPIIMYGMGDGAEKIMKVFSRLGITPSQFMASDEFVRGHSFLGYKVKKLSEIEALYKDFIIIVCFGSSLPEVTERLYRLSERYELYAPDVPVVGEGLFDEGYIKENAEKIGSVREILADEKSKRVFDDIISYKLTGEIKYLKSCQTHQEEAFSLLNIGSEEVYVDLGAYNGDTVEKFLELAKGSFREIFAMEPDPRNFKKLLNRHAGLSAEKFHPVNAAAWSEDAELQFKKSGGRNSSVCNPYGRGATAAVKGKAVDSLTAGTIPTIIKFDVEGCEKEAVEGAKNTIQNHKPRLILSLYHRTEDLLELPLRIKELNCEYKLYLRHHPYIPAWDTNLYCI